MSKVERKYKFEKPNSKFEELTLEGRVKALEQKFTRLTVWTTVITFLLVAVVIAAIIVQIVLNGKAAPIEVGSPEAALHRHSQRSMEGKTAAISYRGPPDDTCCNRLEEELRQQRLELDNFHSMMFELGHHGVPGGNPEMNPPETIPVTFVEDGIEYDYTYDQTEFGSGDDSIFIDTPMYDYDSRESVEVEGSGDGSSFMDDEDLSEAGSGCRLFARPVCSDGCVTSVIQNGCPVPICCQAVPEPVQSSHSSGHHHHHR